MKTDLVVFDIAGTTVADNGSVNEAFRAAFSRAGLKVDPQHVNEVMGYRKLDAINRILDLYDTSRNGAVETSAEDIHAMFTDNMVAFYKQDPELRALPFAEKMFAFCQANSIRVALNTGFTRIITDQILERLGWQNNSLVDMVICSDEVPEGRPYPYMIHNIMKELHISDADNIIKVGDTEVDIIEGRNAGCGLVIAVTTGAYSRSQLSQFNPDHIIDSLGQLPAIISNSRQDLQYHL